MLNLFLLEKTDKSTTITLLKNNDSQTEYRNLGLKSLKPYLDKKAFKKEDQLTNVVTSGRSSSS